MIIRSASCALGQVGRKGRGERRGFGQLEQAPTSCAVGRRWRPPGFPARAPGAGSRAPPTMSSPGGLDPDHPFAAEQAERAGFVGQRRRVRADGIRNDDEAVGAERLDQPRTERPRLRLIGAVKEVEADRLLRARRRSGRSRPWRSSWPGRGGPRRVRRIRRPQRRRRDRFHRRRRRLRHRRWRQRGEAARCNFAILCARSGDG